MKTHCPQCGTMFRATEAQINMADGYVRCGVCENIFNVFEVENSSSIGTDDIPSLSDETTPGEAPSENTTETASEQESLAKTDQPATGTRDDSLDFFNEEVTRSLPHVVPEKLRKAVTSESPSALSTLLWSFGTIALTACLLLEYVWFNRYQYYQSPVLQTVMDNICERLPCEKISMRSPEKIELIARNIYTHPNEKNALMIDVTLKNIARFAQPYPVMHISFSDLRGNKVATRSFLPEEYLAIENRQANNLQQTLLRPDTSTELTLEIQDPGKQATTYEFNFL